MMKCNVFVYGRTKNEDYRWLQKPNIAINSNFFARIIEENSNSLKKDEKLFIFVSTPDLYMLAYIFKDFSSIDERGRPISFVIGITCASLEGREFNYRLPALLQQHHLITKLIQNDLLQVINTNSSFKIKDFDISQVNYIMNQELVSSFHGNATVNSSIVEIAQSLNSKITIPNSESNFKVAELNNILRNKNHRESFIDKDLKENDNSILKVEKELNINKITMSSPKSNFKEIKIKKTVEEKGKSLLRNKLDNFERDDKNVIFPKVASKSNDFKEQPKFQSADFLLNLYDNKREQSFFISNTKVIFKFHDFKKLYQELIAYDKRLEDEYKETMKLIDRYQ